MPRALSSLLVAALLLLVAAGCGDDDPGSDGSGGGGAQQADSGEQACREVEAPAPKADGAQRRPRADLDPSRTYDVAFRTSCGEFTVRLDVEGAPDTTASFAALARSGFYDDTTFHRIVPGFVIQGGDPTGTGTGGPGYKTRDRPPASARYTRGVVAMAKTATEPPGTAGSQFYVVTGADAGLPPEYAIVGEVVDGMDTVERIESLGDPASGGAGTPLRPVVIEEAALDGG
ncbi:MAG: peptidylprolyl isomerase [Thermoleophilaceae bacterium]